ncbi:hypothetical protein J4Q44_G00263840 [Coregonus suidteri]|uniref:Uncharacterized protein n=1 Tax=Coregonus suidteri TaxID=861788 RepID=A0AAN8L7V4_9TELE
MPPFQQVSWSNFCPLELPLSTVSAVIVKWKRLGATTAQLPSGRPHKLTEWDRRVLKHVKIVCPRSHHSLPSPKPSSGSNVSTKTVRRGPPEWCSGLRHCIAVLEASLQTRVRSRAVSPQPAVIGSPIGRPTIGPAPSGLGEGLARGVLLGSSRSSDSLWRAGRLQADLGRQLNGVSSDTLVRLASRLSGRVLRSAVWRVMFRRTHDSTFASRARWGVAAMRQDRNWGEKGG